MTKYPMNTAPKDGTNIFIVFKDECMICYWLKKPSCEFEGWHISDGHTSHFLASGEPLYWIDIADILK